MAKTGNKGFKRLTNATGFSMQGIKAAYQHEEAFRQEVFLLVGLIPAAIYFAGTLAESLILICSVLFVLVVELLNSAIEAVVDRISDDHHELSGRAKDMGSAAVSISLIICAAVWVSILFL
ncbi:Diacylglycerol kinase [hydrothermal vent metagenome]|uniref:Diacylglycerol kinase n=1 Tax=hydrothermal vent metagenome TaxID=652676 RepID=A0A3B0Y7E5_9ZZZZ